MGSPGAGSGRPTRGSSTVGGPPRMRKGPRYSNPRNSNSPERQRHVGGKAYFSLSALPWPAWSRRRQRFLHSYLGRGDGAAAVVRPGGSKLLGRSARSGTAATGDRSAWPWHLPSLHPAEYVTNRRISSIGFPADESPLAFGKRTDSELSTAEVILPPSGTIREGTKHYPIG
jgi:hypothetical protein